LAVNIACILAGGLGLRMAQDGPPKQYRTLNGKPVLLYSLQAFAACDDIGLLCVTAAYEYHGMIRQMAMDAGISKPLVFALPGLERVDSAHNALLAVTPHSTADNILLFHDAARPLVNSRIIKDNIRLASEFDGVYTAIPSSDSVFVSCDGKTLSAQLQRSSLWQGQTPQSFRFAVIKQAHQLYRAMDNPPQVTDDCSLVHLMGGKIAICMGDRRNMKLTTPEDLVILGKYVEVGDKEPS
jgi:2-C-methyl-D-erythritol 4-phosphate cytidylyltransferase